MDKDELIVRLVFENIDLRSENENLKNQLAHAIPVKPLTMMDTVPVFFRMDMPRCSIK